MILIICTRKYFFVSHYYFYTYLFYRWMLKALEIFREITMQNPDPIDSCGPHTIRKLVYDVLSESRAINFNSTAEKIDKPDEIGEIITTTGDDANDDEKNKSISSFNMGLNVYNVRKISGCLLRVPDNFYVDIWHILARTKGGIYVLDHHLPQQPTISKMTR